MAGRAGTGGAGQDRFLTLRDGRYVYKRRVPTAVAYLDNRAPTIREALKTSDLVQARRKRDALEAADNEYWAALLAGGSPQGALRSFDAARRRAEALGFAYRPAAALAAEASLDDLVRRVEAAERQGQSGFDAALGAVEEPRPTVREAFDIYLKDIMPAELAGKSKQQKDSWEKVKRRAVNNFVELVGDKPISEITRADALKVHKFWLERIAPTAGRPTHSASSGNRDIGNMRQLFRTYHDHIGDPERQNPFASLVFSEKNKKTRPPFSTDWICRNFLVRGPLDGMNREARAILLTMVETGARPSEIAALVPERIRLDHEIPHIHIAATLDPDDPSELKTIGSDRLVPLQGVALAALRAFPNGFPRYRRRWSSLSTLVNKYLKRNNLLETDAHKLYSLRHSFEDRMKAAGVDSELRRILVGHTVDRPKYGIGGDLQWRAASIAPMVLPFDPKVI